MSINRWPFRRKPDGISGSLGSVANHVFALGENGLWNSYAFDVTPRTWDGARVAANARTIMGTPGNLVAITSAAENFVVAGVASVNRSVWIGLTDATGPSTLDGRTFPTTEGTFVWVTGEPLSFTNFNGGEPNDFNGAEDAVELTGGGGWNDNAAGSSLGQGDTMAASVVEFRHQLTNAQVAQTPSFKIVSYKSGATQITNLASADALINGFDRIRQTTSYYTRLSMTDSGSEGDFGGDNGVVGVLNEDDFAVQGTGFIRIATGGNYVFRLNADDGQRLRIDTDNNGTLDDIIVDDVLSGAHNVDSASITLSPGLYRTEWTWYERNGGAEGEFSASLNGGAFAVVGDTAVGGLAITQVPEPGSAVLGAFGLLGLLARRRRIA